MKDHTKPKFKKGDKVWIDTHGPYFVKSFKKSSSTDQTGSIFYWYSLSTTPTKRAEYTWVEEWKLRLYDQPIKPLFNIGDQFISEDGSRTYTITNYRLHKDYYWFLYTFTPNLFSDGQEVSEGWIFSSTLRLIPQTSFDMKQVQEAIKLSVESVLDSEIKTLKEELTKKITSQVLKDLLGKK